MIRTIFGPIAAGATPILAVVFASLGALPVAAQSSEYPECGSFPVGEETYACECGADPEGSVWGSGPYTTDSSVCTAAIHQGVITSSGGLVLVVGMPGQEGYEGSMSNGVTSRDWGSYGSSFVFEAKGPRAMAEGLEACQSYDTTLEVMECTCAPGESTGSAWGNGPYTADSDICAAAVHTGVIGPDGGAVRAVRTGGLEAYSGSEFNGVTTRDWGSYSTSFVLDWN